MMAATQSGNCVLVAFEDVPAVDIAVFVSPVEDDGEVGDWRGVGRRDKFGFELEDRYSESHMRQALRSYQDEEDKALQWKKLLEGRQLATLPPNHPKLHSLIRKRGIPPEYRREVWWHICDGKAMKTSMEGFYQSLVSRQLEEKTNDFQEQIEKDLRRTFPGHALFDSEDGVAKLRRVLLAFSLHNSSVGYCQSMNFITAFLLLIFEENQAFSMLVHLIENILPTNYYTKNMLGAVIDQRVFAHLFQQKLAKLNAHCKQVMSHPVHSLCSHWFLCAFVGVFTAEVTFSIWDRLFVDGTQILFQVSLATLKQAEAEIMALDQENLMFPLFKDLPKRMFNSRQLLQLAQTKFSSVHQKRVQELRIRFHDECLQEMQERDAKRNAAILRRKQREEEALAKKPPLSPVSLPKRTSCWSSSPSPSPRKDNHTSPTKAICIGSRSDESVHSPALSLETPLKADISQ